ncbi:MAG TPA: P1 family peptidase [Actinomycetota bacterium]|nr:P1 family peptidase [Actinomycetota bacterium]
MITRVPGIRVGHATDETALTGCTVVLCPPGTIGSGEVRGGAPGTRETDLLRPGMLVEEVDAVLLTGGGAFGLSAADGVMKWLEERGIGFEMDVVKVPIVPAAVLFDLGVGDPRVRPNPSAGYAACHAASEEVVEGSVGAGTGATVAKIRGLSHAMKGGIGTASAEEDGLIVGALVAVNALGEIVDDDGAVLVGARGGDDEGPDAAEPPPGNTTIGAVATNAALSRERAHLLALAAHDGLARAIRPSHTIWDGDTVFTLATGEVEAPQARVEELAERVVAEAIRRGVQTAQGIPGIPGAGDGS